MKQHFWFYLEPYTHALIKKDHLLIYNTLNGSVIEEKGNKEILTLVKGWLARKNGYVIALSAAELQTEPIAQFVQRIRQNMMGDLIDQAMVKGKPVQIPPQVKIMKKVEKHPQDGIGYHGFHVLNNLTGLSIYLNNASTPRLVGAPDFPFDAYRQFTAPCFAGAKKQELKLDSLLDFLHQSKGSMLDRINILGGDIFQYSQFPQLVEALDKIPVHKAYYIRYSQLSGRHAGHLSPITAAGSSVELNVIVDFPICEEAWFHCLWVMREAGLSPRFQFIVTNTQELNQAEHIIASAQVPHFSYAPYYNGRNLDFFKEAVFIDREDVLAELPEQRRILARGVLNPLHYGHLTIMANRHIYANINELKIAVLGMNTLYDVVHRAMGRSQSWHRARTRVKPCSQCVFQTLCPPISNYEHALGRNNLCHIWESVQ